MNRKLTNAVDGERIRAAAFRLKHDLGKAVRWNAPAAREADGELLRARLRLDVGATRERDGRTFGAVLIFEQWRKDEERFFSTEELAHELAALRDSMERVRALVTRIDTLDRGGLVELDEATIQIADRCKSLYRLAVAGAAKAGS